MATKKSRLGPLLVAAFDFGTTYSGYAFSFRDTPLKIQTNQGWNAGTEKLISLKTPTCVLLKPNREFHAFGFDAENKYGALAEDGKHPGWLLFRRFKMLLHNSQGLSRDATVEDINGTSMPAMAIISMAIRYLKDHLLKALNTQTLGVEETDIHYVITVPAIWTDGAKQFMREAAIKAGIDTDRVKLALEPEAASVWCQTITSEVNAALSGPGTQYMVVDLGGGTADISVHEKKADGTLKVLQKASGGPWGGYAVDINYIDWLTNLFGKTTMERFKNEQMADFFDIHREFETKKRMISSDTEGKVTFRVSASMREIYQEEEHQNIKDKIASLGLSDKVICTGDKLRLDVSIVKRWFRGPIGNTIGHIKAILAERRMSNVKIILLVGGFGECELVQTEIREKIRNIRLIVPNEAGLAVLKGAVKFGHTPEVISSRIAPLTYGMEMKIPFDEEVHPRTKMVISNGKKYAEWKFAIFVAQGQEMAVGHEVRQIFIPTEMLRTKIAVYCSVDPAPQFVNDVGCKEIGYVYICHPEGEKLEDKKFEVTFLFGDTELHVKIKLLKTGKEFSKVIDCL